jgi:hypothetical protein
MTSSNFDDLKDIINIWGLETPHQRLQKRSSSSLPELRAFYDRIVPRLEDILNFLNQFPLHGIPEEYKKLGYTALATLEVDDAINLWKRPTLELAHDIRDWKTKKSFYST